MNDIQEYEALVEEGLAITDIVSSKQWAYGDLADKVEKAYGENRLEQFAEDINFAGVYTTLDGYRRVCRAFPKTMGRPRFFASAQVLAAYPEPSALKLSNAILQSANVKRAPSCASGAKRRMTMQPTLARMTPSQQTQGSLGVSRRMTPSQSPNPQRQGPRTQRRQPMRSRKTSGPQTIGSGKAKSKAPSTTSSDWSHFERGARPSNGSDWPGM